MHRLAATPGGWTPDTEGVIFIEQTPAPIVFLTAADTDIQCLARVMAQPPEGLPAVRGANLLQLQQQLTIDTYGEQVLAHAQIIVLRLLGGRGYWSYGLEVVAAIAAATGAALVVLPGDDRPDPDLISHSTVALTIANQLWRYLIEGGVDNLRYGLQYLCDRCLDTHFQPPVPETVPRLGIYKPAGIKQPEAAVGQVGLLFYRAHYLAANTAPIDALCQALIARNLAPVPVYVSALQDPEVQAELLDQFVPEHGLRIDVLLNTTSFAVARLSTATPKLDLWMALDVPVIQVILSGSTVEAWQSHPMGLGPRDIAMNVALPEVDGRIISRAVSFKTTQHRSDDLETPVVGYEPVGDRIDFVADLAASWGRLRRKPSAERRIALVLANYPNRDGRLANGVGLDTPQSCVEILQALKAAGYQVGTIPEDSGALMAQLTAGVTNDPESRQARPIHQSLPLKTYQAYFEALPTAVQSGIQTRWGQPEQAALASLTPGDGFPIAGVQMGQVFVGIQPSRGYDRDPSLNYHAPDLEPTHDYLAFYHWLRSVFNADAVVHVGKHGNLEWLPGKGVGLSATCYPEIALGPIPHFYPFIVNDPGEGAQAKRRAQAVIIDHLTPPLTRAELYGPLQKLEGLVDEYYEAQSLDPKRLSLIRDRILTVLTQTSLLDDLGIVAAVATTTGATAKTAFTQLLPQLDGYLCELKEAQIRDGLHIFGRCPAGEQLRDLVVAIARHPSENRLGLTRTLALDWQLGFDPLTADLGQPFAPPRSSDRWRTIGDAVEALEDRAADLVNQVIQDLPLPALAPTTQAELTWIGQTLVPALRATDQEITHLLQGLGGHYVPSGPAGAPTRNRPDVLPTGRNFYSVDIRAIPTESAWDVGRRAAEALVERYTQDHGDYPQAIGLSVWGTATMRTGGDDLAEALALLGVCPVWDGPSRRVVDFEILPLVTLGRPRVDVTLRISGFFRDAFPNLIDLFDQAVAAVADLKEPPEENPLAANSRAETQQWQQQGLTFDQAQERSKARIFGSKPGAYGAGLQGLIEAQNWTDDGDLARAYINWSSYAYGRDQMGRSAPEAFSNRLAQMQVVLHNQDNREHDLLDSDDYYQFQGGLTAAVKAVQGKQPQTYFGDHAVSENPKVRSLREEITRVYRSRVVNPKWIAGVMRHGYKGAFEMAATVDYLFAYDATTHCVADHIYEGVANAYLLDASVQAFIQAHNPWALRDIAERLLEADQRKLWRSVTAERLDQLRAIVHSAEADIEMHQGYP
jgi:cobaltochelatase CobN